MAQINHFVPKLVSVIKGSAAYQDGGLIIVTFDEAEVPKRAETLHYLPEDEEQDTDTNAASDWNRSCCDEQPGPGWRDPGLTGPGGGRVGAILISPFIRENSRPDEHPYNHYSLLRTLEDLFDLHKKDEGAVEHLGYANQDGLKTFQSCHLFNQVPVSKPQPVINTQ